MESTFRIAESDTVADLNTASEADAARTLSLCLDVPRWVREVLNARPFTDVQALRHAIHRAATPLTADEVHRTLAVHPRIGETPDGDDASARHASNEQSGVDVSDEGVEQRLRAGNLAYENRFGQVFLIRAAGRDAHAVLDALHSRLGNDPATEAVVVEHELREIAEIRATGSLGDV
ncbi:2-oxo-4-hydroxy-4-carboxy-5-ureidoimidazoline decarboxylase [Rhodococcus sp. IEGM 1401]|uniref:2-oxo-4-hydroxy-4-carboxy-5-ureidoimidazoline decarboxylase n=1 Tax=unclassified Rhodococcus (in: high G+C Gram-positive bacteria) TaxID=192944 RepID=UPI0022B4FC53|nr:MULTISPECIES: 2-oxo-4-hydroxy-4-carboxy-5-ureidoimidazoline decarboxylase [unclassified Rhodococcus (in: high G+C Gram-positive bacteria)]MCZ4563138.1 2-oxo-4-hydroxy-4-carboxy-5-ureidoimidazoline decarboxylase [Rhodococcus sp. IEGM 1401]MDV8034790.1 2-oxo-4-hydroxy-4-carboxy-5-ureidoimidazoline decarboxylase [Rhodococcus sp. IEGM 1414]MDV8077046.1 2-oxo-4-hydroxy-4-carboxy-5-ureidoimidazoline decarboxylase [Rhodococcus sp. IEGM 1370]